VLGAGGHILSKSGRFPRYWRGLSRALSALASCRTRSQAIYTWGNYAGMVRSLTELEGAAHVVALIDRLAETIESARVAGEPVASGVHAHIGLLYSIQGEVDGARAAFEAERELFPGSEAFIDGVIQRMVSSSAWCHPAHGEPPGRGRPPPGTGKSEGSGCARVRGGL